MSGWTVPWGRTLGRRARRNEALGEVSLLTGEPRSATLVAAVPTTILELDRQAFADVIHRHPEILRNIALMLVERQKLGDDYLRHRHARSEAVALVVGEGHWALAESALRAANGASVGPLAVIDLGGMLSVSALEGVRTVVAALDAFDRALAKHRTVVMVTDTGQQDLSLLLRHMDRAVALANATQVRSIASLGDDAMRLELFLRGWPDSACDARSIAREARSLDIQNTIVSRPAMAGTPSVPD